MKVGEKQRDMQKVGKIFGAVRKMKQLIGSLKINPNYLIGLLMKINFK